MLFLQSCSVVTMRSSVILLFVVVALAFVVTAAEVSEYSS